MKITSIELLESIEGLNPFSKINLGNVVILTGSNGSGKTRLLKLLQKHIASLKNGHSTCPLRLEISTPNGNEYLSESNAEYIDMNNYSHYDAKLQSPNKFTPYVISKAKEKLKICDYEETALNSLLLLEDMACGYSSEFQDGNEFLNIKKQLLSDFNITIGKNNNNNLEISNLELEKASLSPGQQYLLRIEIACNYNQKNEDYIFILDEPELHLHPAALITAIEKLRKNFPNTQFWISTHSLALISNLMVSNKNTTVLFMENGNTTLFRSNSTQLLKGLVGEEENIFSCQQLLVLPDQYACNKFSVECSDPPKTLNASGDDPQTNLIETVLNPNNVVIDYGAGKGRFLEELSISGKNNIAQSIIYYAYDKFKDDASKCKYIMKQNGFPEDNYFNNINDLINKINNEADYVLLINVLHEIPPIEWKKLFESISKLLKDSGKLIIVEREELTIGESPYDEGFLMITKSGSEKLFGKNNVKLLRHPQKHHIVKYVVSKEGLFIDSKNVYNCISQIKEDSLYMIKKIKSETNKNDKNLKKYKVGIKLAFYLQQFANASILSDNLYEIILKGNE